MNHIVLIPSPLAQKKYRVIFPNNTHVDFGALGYSDFTLHKDPLRQQRYIQRHQKNENWKITGIHTKGFWSRWILWNLDSLRKSIKDTEKRFNLKIFTGYKYRSRSK